MSRRTTSGDEDGSLTIQFVLAVGLSLVLFTVLANLVVAQYLRGAAVAAADEAARTGALVTAPANDPIAACTAAASETFRGLVPGPAGARSEVRCSADADVVVATLRATLAAWVPLYPDLTFEVTASAARERLP